MLHIVVGAVGESFDGSFHSWVIVQRLTGRQLRKKRENVKKGLTPFKMNIMKY